MNTESFVMYESVFKQVQILEKKLGKETAYDFMKAVTEFGLYGILPDEESDVWLYGFEQTITSIAAAKDRRKKSIEDGAKGGRPKTFSEKEIMGLKEQGLTNKQVSERLGCSVSTVEKTVKTVKTHKNLNVNENENENGNENEKENENEKINNKQTRHIDTFRSGREKEEFEKSGGVVIWDEENDYGL